MGFYKNANTTVKEYQPGDEINVGDCGKYIRTTTNHVNEKLVDSKHIYIYRPKYDHLTIREPDRNDFESSPALNYFDVTTATEDTIEYDVVVDRKTTYYKATLVNDRFGSYKFASTRVRKACGACVFAGKCDIAPWCTNRIFTSQVYHGSRPALKLEDIKDAYFFEEGKTISERISSEHKSEQKFNNNGYGYW